jgi:general secretion pathway protein I
VKGFTLLEVMIALAIMAGVILTVISSFNYHLSVVGRDREETFAVLLAREKMADVNFRFTESGKGTFAPDWPDYTWETAIQPTDYSWLKRGTMTISWDTERRKISFVKYLPQ